MDPIRLRVARIMDFGSIVSIIGTDMQSNKPVMVHVDHRPFEAIWSTWKAASFPQPIAFDAEHLTLDLAIQPDDSGGGGERVASVAA